MKFINNNIVNKEEYYMDISSYNDSNNKNYDLSNQL